jgi:hypothetical protein
MVDQALGFETARRRHWEVLAVAGAVCALALTLQEVPGGRVAVRGAPRFPLPQVCASRSVFGVKCPGCGLTRSIIHVAEGDWRASWRSHRLGGLMAIVIVFQIPYRLAALRRLDRPLLPIRWQVWLSSALIALLIGNWLVDLLAGRVTDV